MELDKLTTDKAWATDASGRFKNLPVEILDHLSSTVVCMALTLDMAGVMTFATSDVWRKMLLTCMRDAPLPSYAKINVEQAKKSMGGDGRGKAKGKVQGTRNKLMPAPLRGQNHVIASGDHICYDYNLAHGCNLANAPHVCTKCCGAHGSVPTHGAASPVASY